MNCMNMNCIRCNSNRILSLNAKSNDCNSIALGDKEHIGYLPSSILVGSGDYISFEFCLECGQIQEKFPIDDPDFGEENE